MSAAPHKASRYATLRGKSISESRRVGKNGQTDAISSSFRSSLGSPGWKQRSKTQESLNKIDISAIDPDFPVPPIPRPPSSQRNHSDTTRPRAAVVPRAPAPGPFFQEPVTPALLRTRRSTPSMVPLPDSPPPSVSSADSTAPYETPCQVTGSGEQSRQSRDYNSEDQLVLEEDPLLLADLLEAETDKILAEQKRLDMARIHQRMIATESRFSLTPSSATRTTPRKSPMLERLAFFSRGRRSQAISSSASSTTASVDYSHGQMLEPLLSPGSFWEPSLQLMTPPTSPMSPQRDLKKSVAVCYRGEMVNVLITDHMHTSVDILSQAAKLMRSPVNTSASNLHECCGSYGIERRLRRYERITDVLDSWTPDAHNLLVIRHAESPESDSDLDIQFVPVDETPPSFTLQVYHCSRPGKWQKRWITLLEDGQMLSSKRARLSHTDSDTQRLCDLSCYDIYTAISEPTMLLDDRYAQNSRNSPVKSLKPPKKHVFAVRCQGRPTAYSEIVNYVHFFCTDNQAVADEFKALSHVWRSWYMIKTRRDNQRKRLMMDAGAISAAAPRIGPAPRITPVKHVPVKSISHIKVSPGHMLRISVDMTPHTIPATIDDIEPLVDMERFQKHIDDFGKDWVPDPKFVLPPATPGADSAISMTTPSTMGLLGQEDQSPGVASPAELRRMRRDNKKSLASIGQQQPSTTDGPSSIFIAVTEPDASPTRSSRAASDATVGRTLTEPPPPPPKPDVAPWLPSAAEHTARLRLEQVRESVHEQARLNRLNSPVTPKRPATSHGSVGGAGSGGPGRRGGRSKSKSVSLEKLDESNALEMSQSGNFDDWMKGSYFDPSVGPNSRAHYLEVPQSHSRGLASKKSMPALTGSSSTYRSGGGPQVPAIWRTDSKRSSSPKQRPATSGGERASSHRRDRSGSSASSLRHGHGSQNDSVPPVPPMPLLLRQGVKKRPSMRERGRSLTARP